MKAEWRTETVVMICRSMRETCDYSGCPILADALEDAGCDDADTLTTLRSDLSEREAERLVCLTYSDETADAVAAVEEFARNLGPRAFCEEGDDYGEKTEVTYERMMNIGDRWTLNSGRWGGERTTENGSDDLRDNYSGRPFEEFWKGYRVITGRQGGGNPFSCTC